MSSQTSAPSLPLAVFVQGCTGRLLSTQAQSARLNLTIDFCKTARFSSVEELSTSTWPYRSTRAGKQSLARLKEVEVVQLRVKSEEKWRSTGQRRKTHPERQREGKGTHLVVVSHDLALDLARVDPRDKVLVRPRYEVGGIGDRVRSNSDVALLDVLDRLCNSSASGSALCHTKR